MEKIYERPKTLTDRGLAYCPGCLHGVATRLIAELLDEMDQRTNAVAVLAVGCGTLGMFHFNTDVVVSPHGRTPAVATGAKRAAPGKLVFSYQGDGDLAAIGMAEIMHAANRGENFTVIFINNSTYGMTGGQMAPTTLVGQKTTTSRQGRNPGNEGGPIRMAEIMAQLDGVAYAARCALDSVKHVRAAKKAMRKAFDVQLQGLGFGFVELLAGCPTNWHLDPIAANRRIAEAMIPVFPLGVYKDASLAGATAEDATQDRQEDGRE